MASAGANGICATMDKFRSKEKTALAVFSISGMQVMTKCMWALVFGAFCQSFCPLALAQDKVYRCGNEYTNNVTRDRAAECTLITTGNVTVVPAVKPPALANVPPEAQRAKDADARAILESELKKAEARRAELLKEFNNGEPEKMGAEARNYQKYLDRVAEMKASIQRTEADIASIRREISRLPGGTR